MTILRETGNCVEFANLFSMPERQADAATIRTIQQKSNANMFTLLKDTNVCMSIRQTMSDHKCTVLEYIPTDSDIQDQYPTSETAEWFTMRTPEELAQPTWIASPTSIYLAIQQVAMSNPDLGTMMANFQRQRNNNEPLSNNPEILHAFLDYLNDWQSGNLLTCIEQQIKGTQRIDWQEGCRPRMYLMPNRDVMHRKGVVFEEGRSVSSTALWHRDGRPDESEDFILAMYQLPDHSVERAWLHLQQTE